MKKHLRIIVAGVLVVGILAAVAFAATPSKKTEAKKAKKPGQVIVVEDADFSVDDEQILTAVSEAFEMEPQVKRISHQEALQDEQLKGVDFSFLPVFLVEKTDVVREKLAEPLAQGYLTQTKDYVVFTRQTHEGVHTAKTPKPGVMEIFVMSQCPYGVMAETAVINAQKSGQWPKAKDVRVRYIVNYDPRNGFRSLHGSGEWEENVRQLLIAKYYPEKFWKYLEIRNKDYRSSRWDKAMEDAGINVKKIMKKFDTEGLELLKQEAAYSDEYNVDGSPTFLWEGRRMMSFGSAAQTEGFDFLNPNSGKAGAAAQVPAGSC